MTRKPQGAYSDFNAMKKMGLEFEAPQDEFGYQPDSGSTANGALAKQEYGIDVDRDAETHETGDLRLASDSEDSSVQIPGESSYSQEHRRPKEDSGKALMNDADEALYYQVKGRLSELPRLRKAIISVSVSNGVVSLHGEVPDSGTKATVEKLIGSLPGVSKVSCELGVLRPM